MRKNSILFISVGKYKIQKMANNLFASNENVSTWTSETWNDNGTGGLDWGIHVVHPPCCKYKRVSDIVVKYSGPRYSAPYFLGKILLVNSEIPDAIKPATDYIITRVYSNVRDHLTISHPVCQDSNYIALGQCGRKGDNVKPAPGDYYLVHKKYLLEQSNGSLLLNEDGMYFRSTVNGYSTFFTDSDRHYKLREEQDLINCCSGSNSDICDDYTTNSLTCSKYMNEYCSTDDLKFGGKCYDWCSRDPASCDNAKLSFCADHPNDSLCSCINATEQPDYIKMVSEHPEIYGTSLPICFYSKCKLQDDKQFYTKNLKTLQQSQRCAVDLTLIDQAIKVLGDNNVLDTSQTATAIRNNGVDSKTPNDGKTPIEEPINYYKILLIFIAIIAAVIGIVFGVRKYINKNVENSNFENKNVENDYSD